MCNSIKNLIQKSKKEPNIKDVSAIQESRRKMSDNPTSIKLAQHELQKTSLKLDSSTDVSESGSVGVVVPIDRDKISEAIDPVDHNIPVIDENDDSSSTFSEAEKL